MGRRAEKKKRSFITGENIISQTYFEWQQHQSRLCMLSSNLLYTFNYLLIIDNSCPVQKHLASNKLLFVFSFSIFFATCSNLDPVPTASASMSETAVKHSLSPNPKLYKQDGSLIT